MAGTMKHRSCQWLWWCTHQSQGTFLQSCPCPHSLSSEKQWKGVSLSLVGSVVEFWWNAVKWWPRWIYDYTCYTFNVNFNYPPLFFNSDFLILISYFWLIPKTKCPRGNWSEVSLLLCSNHPHGEWRHDQLSNYAELLLLTSLHYSLPPSLVRKSEDSWVYWI